VIQLEFGIQRCSSASPSAKSASRIERRKGYPPRLGYARVASVSPGIPWLPESWCPTSLRASLVPADAIPGPTHWSASASRLAQGLSRLTGFTPGSPGPVGSAIADACERMTLHVCKRIVSCNAQLCRTRASADAATDDGQTGRCLHKRHCVGSQAVLDTRHRWDYRGQEAAHRAQEFGRMD
jgi:hypothetical protein